MNILYIILLLSVFISSCRAADDFLGSLCDEDTNTNSSSQAATKSTVLLNAEKMLAVKTIQVAYKMQRIKSDNSVRFILMQGFGTTIAFYGPKSFKKELAALMDKIRSEAVMPNTQGLGKGKTKLPPLLTLYALVQCIRDLAMIDCAQCLAFAVENFENYCDNKKGCRVVYTSCYFRYELYPFFFPLDSKNGISFGKKVIIVRP